MLQSQHSLIVADNIPEILLLLLTGMVIKLIVDKAW